MLYFDEDKAYDLSKKYLDHYTMAKIAFSNKSKYYNDLKGFMRKVLSKKKGHVKYLLQLILEFEMKYIEECKNNNNIIFNYFEDFDEFQEISEISKNSAKLLNFYNLYLLKKNIETKINDSNGHHIVQNIVNYMKNNEPSDYNFNNNKMQIDNLIKIVCLDKALNLIKHSYISNDNNVQNINNKDENVFIENINEDNIIYEILQLCQDKNYKNILNNSSSSYVQKSFYEKSLQFLHDYFENFVMPSENENEVKNDSYIILFILNELIKNKKMLYNNLKPFISEIINKCILLDKDDIYNKLGNDENYEENENQKINLIYRITSDQSIVIKLSKYFKYFYDVFLNTINEIRENEMSKNENNRILHLEEFTNILNNLIKPENMENINNAYNNIININKIEEEDII